MVQKTLRFENGPRAGETVLLDKPRVVFGRKQSCDCVLAHATVSREHFFVELNDRKHFVVDCDSGNGTLVNGERVKWAELHHGDRVQAGPFSFVFVLDTHDDGAEVSSVAEQAKPAGRVAKESNDAPALAVYRGKYPDEYLDGIEHFNAGRYYEAHELWEEMWVRAAGEEKLFLQMLIQAAVALHHYDRGNLRGARNLYRTVTDKLARYSHSFLGIDLAGFAATFTRCLSSLNNENEETTLPPIDSRPQIALLPGD
jgi:pSer/pThr/pTyr-binding forkhead associated (FHA) protein